MKNSKIKGKIKNSLKKAKEFKEKKEKKTKKNKKNIILTLSEI